jgi:signal transduction histidine kinase
MKREGKTARPEGKEDEAAIASTDLTASILSILEEVSAGRSPGRGYEATVRAAAHGSTGTASLWRFEKDDPILLAAAGKKGEELGEELLAAMKETSARMQSGAGVKGAGVSGKDARDLSRELPCFSIDKFGERWGALVVSPGKPREGSTEFLRSLAEAAGLITERAALHDEIAHLRGRVATSENARDPMVRYARLGQLAGQAYEEVAKITDAVEKRLSKSLRVPVKVDLEEALADVRKVRAILQEQLELAQLEMPVLAMGSLSEIVQGAVRDIEGEASRKSLRLLKRLDPTLPSMLLDSDKLRMAIDKILAAAVVRSEPEGWLKVESDADSDEAQVQVTWEEKGQPGSITQDMFVPFGPLGKGGAGLAVASQIIREHGGGICAKRFPSGTTALVMTIPISANQDRRRRRSRRSGLDRRNRRSAGE